MVRHQFPHWNFLFLTDIRAFWTLQVHPECCVRAQEMSSNYSRFLNRLSRARLSRFSRKMVEIKSFRFLLSIVQRDTKLSDRVICLVEQVGVSVKLVDKLRAWNFIVEIDKLPESIFKVINSRLDLGSTEIPKIIVKKGVKF